MVWVYFAIMDETKTHDKISLLRLAFQGLDEDELQEVASLTEFRTYPPEYVLCREGAYEDVFYIVADGSVIISKTMGEGEADRVLREGGKGDLVGEMALIQNAPRAATVRTTTTCTVLEMEKKDFETILSRSPRMAIDIIRVTLDRIRANDQTMIAELQKSNKVLRQLDRNKLEFIQVAAHELRTPLTVLLGYVKVLRSFVEAKADASLNGVMDGIIKGTDRIHEIVNMMLDVTRIDADTLKIVPTPIPMKRIINDLVHDFETTTVERKIEITVEHSEDTLNIQGDPALIQKALYQLIVNAIKYTPDGGKVRITTRRTLMDNDTSAVEITIKDTGIGLDVEHHELVFEKFYQVGSVAIHSSGKTTFKGGGPGLGLAIVRGVARAHGGKTWVESAGHDEVNFPGCAFYLQLPLVPPSDLPTV
jgi:signal transduction histidine kinase